MFVRLVPLLIIFSVVHLNYAKCARKVGGWQKSGAGDLQTEAVNLAQQQLNSATESIRVLSFNTQVVAGTNLRLVFIANEQQKCTLIAFKPLPYRNEPTQVTSFKCDDIPSEDNVTTNND